MTVDSIFAVDGIHIHFFRGKMVPEVDDWVWKETPSNFSITSTWLNWYTVVTLSWVDLQLKAFEAIDIIETFQVLKDF